MVYIARLELAICTSFDDFSIHCRAILSLISLLYMEVKAEIAFQIVKQGKRYIAHAPALDLSTSGKSEAEAKSRFAEIVPLFFDELMDAGTLNDVLSELGWRKNDSAPHAGWLPPVVTNEQMQVQIPVMA